MLIEKTSQQWRAGYLNFIALSHIFPTLWRRRTRAKHKFQWKLIERYRTLGEGQFIKYLLLPRKRFFYIILTLWFWVTLLVGVHLHQSQVRMKKMFAFTKCWKFLCIYLFYNIFIIWNTFYWFVTKNSKQLKWSNMHYVESRKLQNTNFLANDLADSLSIFCRHSTSVSQFINASFLI